MAQGPEFSSQHPSQTMVNSSYRGAGHPLLASDGTCIHMHMPTHRHSCIKIIKLFHDEVCISGKKREGLVSLLWVLLSYAMYWREMHVSSVYFRWPHWRLVDNMCLNFLLALIPLSCSILYHPIFIITTLSYSLTWGPIWLCLNIWLCSSWRYFRLSKVLGNIGILGWLFSSPIKKWILERMTLNL